MYLGGEELRFESHVTTVRQNSSNLQIRKLKWHGCINKYVFIPVMHLLTLLTLLCFSATQWTFLFETAAKRAVKYVKRCHTESAQRYIFL